MMTLTSLVASAAAQIAVATLPPGYQATVLPQLDPGDGDGGNTLIFTSPTAISGSGVVVGNAGFYNGFVWSSGGSQHVQAPSSLETSLASVNLAGDVVGNYLPADAFGFRPFHYSGGAFTLLPSLVSGLGAGTADINDSGMIVGSAERAPGGTFGGPRSAVYWMNGQVHEIGHLGGDSAGAAAVNNNNVVVGAANTPGALALQPFRWTESGGMEVLPQLVEGVPSTPADINDQGVIVGRGGVSLFANEAVYWTPDGTIHQLPRLHDTADIGVLAINNHGIMVGQEMGPGFSPEARLWFEDQVYDLADMVVDLPTGLSLLEAVGINDQGDIIVQGSMMVDGHIEQVAVLLTPVPGPGVLALAAPAVLAGVGRRRRPAR